MARTHSNTYKVVAYTRCGLKGTYQRIIACNATKTSTMKEYAEHMARFPASAPSNYSYVYLYQDDTQVETLAI